MTGVISDDEIYNKLISVLVEALRVKPDQIKPDSRLLNDLGAESIDIIDIRFQLEKVFGVKIEEGEIFMNMNSEISLKQIFNIFTVKNTFEFIKSKLMKN